MTRAKHPMGWSRWEQIARELGRLRSELNESRRSRRANPCEYMVVSDIPTEKVAPCFTRTIGDEPLWSVAPDEMCPNCRANGVRAKHENQLKRAHGALLRGLQWMHEHNTQEVKP